MTSARAIAYLCNTFATEWPPSQPWPEHAAAEVARVRATAIRFCSTDLGHLLPGAVGPEGFRWELLAGSEGLEGEAAFDTQFWRANIDPSDRYVLSLPGTDAPPAPPRRERLREPRSSPATGRTTASTRDASRRPCSRGSRRPTRCSAATGSTASPAGGSPDPQRL